MTATDDDGDTLTYTLEGDDALSFGIDSSSGQIQTIAGVTYDYEAKSVYSVTLQVDDGKGGTDTIIISIGLTDVDEPPSTPNAPAVTPVTGSTTSLSVSWTAPDNTGKPDIQSYDLQYRQGTSGDWSDGPQDVTFGTVTIGTVTIGGLDTGTEFQVRVRATNDEGTSGWSSAGSGTTNAALAPTVSSVVVTSNPGADETYAPGDPIQVTVTFDQAVTVNTSGGTPRIQLRVGGGDPQHLKWADYESGSGNEALLFAYTVQAGDQDGNGIYIAADELVLNGGTIQSSGGTDANLDYPLQGTQSGHKVDGVGPTPEAAWTSDGGASIIILFSEPLHMTTAPASAFTLAVDPGTAPAVSSATASGNSVTLGLDSALTADQVVSVMYVDATSSNDSAAVQDAVGNDAADFTQTIESTVPQPVPSNWGLIPDGLGPGARFRLIFVSSNKRDGSSTDIDVYNTFVQTAAGGGHADIQGHRATFRVVGSTADVDARDNTNTGYTGDDTAATDDDSDLGVPIYWLEGAKVADDYRDFYDNAWDDEINAKDQSGADRNTLSIANWPITGSGANGTERFSGATSRALGADRVQVGRLDTVGNGPLSSVSTVPKGDSRPLYGLSGVFVVDAAATDATLSALSLSGVTLSPGFAADTPAYTASVGSAVDSTTVTATPNDDGATVEIAPADADDTTDGHQVSLAVGDTTVSVTVTAEDGTTMQTYAVTVTRADAASTDTEVPANWSLIPSGLDVGGRFRLIFISSGTRNGSSTEIGVYNTFVQNAAAAGHADIRDHSSTFRVVGSTADVDARDNTYTTYAADDTGVAIYWLGGAKVADDYAGFYDGEWDDEANARDESGNVRSTSGSANWPFTGSTHDGIESFNFANHSKALGANLVRG